MLPIRVVVVRTSNILDHLVPEYVKRLFYYFSATWKFGNMIENSSYLVIQVGGPEPCHGPIIEVGREKVWACGGPGLIDVLDDDHGLADRLASMDEDRDLLVGRVRLQEELTLAAKCLLQVFVLYTFKIQGNFTLIT